MLVPGSLQPQQFTEQWGKGEHTLHSEHIPAGVGLRPGSEQRAKAQLLSSSLYFIANVLTQAGPDIVRSIQRPDVLQLCGEERTFTGQGRDVSSDHTANTSFLPAALSTGFYIQRSFR